MINTVSAKKNLTCLSVLVKAIAQILQWSTVLVGLQVVKRILILFALEVGFNFFVFILCSY